MLHVGKNVSNKSSKEQGKKERKKISNELGKKVCKNCIAMK